MVLLDAAWPVSSDASEERLIADALLMLMLLWFAPAIEKSAAWERGRCYEKWKLSSSEQRTSVEIKSIEAA